MLGNNTHHNTNAPAYDAAGNPVNAGHHNTSTTGTGGGIASKIPGTKEHEAKKELEHGYGTNTGAGHSATGTGPVHGQPGSVAHGSHAPGHHNTTHSSTHPSGPGGIAAKIPGTEANREKKMYENEATPGYGNAGATGAGYPTSGTGTGYGHSGTVAPDSHAHGHHNMTHSSTGAGAGGIASKIPGTAAHDATHPTHHNTTTGTTHTGPHTGNTTHGAHGTHGTHGTHHDASAKPSMTDKIGGKIDVAIGKATKNPTKVVEGEIKQTQGKAGLEHNVAGTTGTHY
ncbi:uncharacterized protein JCM6883_001648 [Sporobolomyces salmoneus]|uniref:uncharacterized protein n=1 Tax=Sporobolomyces salmoneus TaxID=183962 RepID=UPI00316C3AF9